MLLMTTTGRPPRLSTVFQKYRPPLYFVTICCANRKHLLANEMTHIAFREFALRGQADHNVAVGRYVLMPDHLHLFVCGPAKFRLEQWVRLLKTTLGRKLRDLSHEPDLWQRGFFDHLVRNLESYAEAKPGACGLGDET